MNNAKRRPYHLPFLTLRPIHDFGLAKQLSISAFKAATGDSIA
jgi:hypothetical protein